MRKYTPLSATLRISDGGVLHFGDLIQPNDPELCGAGWGECGYF